MNILNNTPFQIETLPSKGPDGRTFLTIIVKGTCDFCNGDPAPVAAEQIPILFGDEFYNEDGGSIKFESDIAPFKPRADIVLLGRAYAPPGRETVQAVDVLLRVGQIRKILRIIGDRSWIGSTLLSSERRSEPEPFAVMDIVYERAFGGIDTESGEFCKENLLGKGFIGKGTKKLPEGTPLPNIEDPRDLIDSWGDHPRPVGFGFYSRAWMPRAGYVGTYNEKWRKEHSPDPPEDFRFDYYNAAHPDLQVEGYLRGDEEIELVNLMPDGRIRFQLPGISLNCTVTKTFEFTEIASSQSPVTEEIRLNLDTLCLIPDEKRFYLVWRGCCSVLDLDASEVKTVEIV